MTIDPDTKNWTWVLERDCEECGFDIRSFPPEEIADLLREAAEPWQGWLADPLARVRPEPGTWSALEYGCHVRDVFRIGLYRVNRMLNENDPQFDNWDQDETALAERYDLQDPVAVAGELAEADAAFAAVYDRVGAEQWRRPGLRSDGSPFSVESFGRYYLHDLMHHIVDVRRGYEILEARR